MMQKSKDKIIVDFHLTDSEAGWVRRLDELGLKATPIWFNWLGWIILLGALHYIYSETENFTISIVYGISYGLLFLYFNAFFFRIEFKNIPILSRLFKKQYFSGLISALIAIAFWRFAGKIAQMISEFQ